MTLDFTKQKVHQLDFETLKRTHKENDIYGNPIKDIYHYQLINEIAELCYKNSLDFEISNIFAAQNNSRNTPGVVVLPQVELVHGENAVEAHILRRVFANIEIKNNSNSEMTSNIAIAYHQSGIQVGVGPMVVVCRNQTIMASERMYSNYGKGRMETKTLIQGVGEWLKDFFNYQETDLQVIEQMKSREMNEGEVLRLIGMLTAMRVSKDSKYIEHSPQVYPLNQSQISQFTEDYLRERQSRAILTMWEIYNIATKMYKATEMDIPGILPQNGAMVALLKDWE